MHKRRTFASASIQFSFPRQTQKLLTYSTQCPYTVYSDSASQNPISRENEEKSMCNGLTGSKIGPVELHGNTIDQR